MRITQQKKEKRNYAGEICLKSIKTVNKIFLIFDSLNKILLENLIIYVKNQLFNAALETKMYPQIKLLSFMLINFYL